MDPVRELMEAQIRRLGATEVSLDVHRQVLSFVVESSGYCYAVSIAAGASELVAALLGDEADHHYQDENDVYDSCLGMVSEVDAMVQAHISRAHGYVVTRVRRTGRME